MFDLNGPISTLSCSKKALIVSTASFLVLFSVIISIVDPHPLLSLRIQAQSNTL